MLAKQGWRLITYPNSLLAIVLKAKYYLHSNFFNAQLGNLPSLTWKSVWAATGRGIGISVWDDYWMPGKDTNDWSYRNDNEVKLVYDLIDATNNLWKIDLVKSTFPADIAQKFCKSLWQKPQALIFKCGRESFLADLKSFYKQLWNLQLPSKITITVWRASWNYMPTLVNVRSKRVADNTVCPRCRSGEEDISYVFRYCHATIEVWQMLNLY
ncbi:Ribonuclease H-like superfamily protein [Gossypium australe]|uniref:Ribonuclease H-like superfamily protein n=1 Tax=Gossypium australe TaxID=47621 RepID=A0A5B6WVZ8_9ROSI|nr:Ribonuclease H-like superfamily protein [Gossypium australe]